MNYLITENQLRFLLQEADESKIENKVKSLSSFAKEVWEKSGLLRKLNLKFWSTWGAAMGGFIKPLSDFIETQNFDISPQQAAVILVGVTVSYFFQNEEDFKKIHQIIKEEGLEEIYKKVSSRAFDLKKGFIKFLSSLNISFSTVVEMMHYSFLIPIFSDLQTLSTGSSDLSTTAMMIAKRIIASEAVLISGSFLVKVIDRILKKLSTKK
jgi:hypothetical protein